jgi:hypothetical protein
VGQFCILQEAGDGRILDFGFWVECLKSKIVGGLFSA